MIASFLFDALAYIGQEPYKRDLHVAGFYTLLLGALATLAATLSGLAISAWQFFGDGTLAKHHDFVWPTFGLMIGLAVWRLVVRGTTTRPAFGVYLVASVCLVSAGTSAANF